MQHLIPPQPAVMDWPLYWFGVLEKAVEKNDWPAADQAKRELERLGVTVHWRPRHALDQQPQAEEAVT